MTVGLPHLESTLSRSLCPNCFHSELEAVLRCDLEWRTCLATIHCGRCGYSFEPVTERRALDLIEQRIAAGALEVACPSCGSRRHRAEFRCDLSSHRCCYFLLCQDCGEVHQLYA